MLGENEEFVGARQLHTGQEGEWVIVIIVQKHNGELSVTSQPGQTCFQAKLRLTLQT